MILALFVIVFLSSECMGVNDVWALKNTTSDLSVFATAGHLKQSWAKNQNTEIEGGFYQLKRTPEGFVLSADLVDSYIYSEAKNSTDFFWDKGDLIELLIKKQSENQYYEFHVASSGVLFQVRWPSFDIFMEFVRAPDKKIYIAPHLLQTNTTFSNSKNKKGWSVELRIPYEVLESNPKEAQEIAWRYVVCRNNIFKDKRVEYSAGSNFSKPFFHKLEEWSYFQ